MTLNISIKYIKKPTKKDFEIFDKFDKDHWGESIDTPEEEAKNFFDTNKSAVVAYVGDELVGMCFLHFRKSTINTKSFSFVGIGSVLTHKSFRHKGIASKILNETKKFSAEKHIDVALLTTDIPRLGILYAKMGFVALNRPYIFIDKNGNEQEDTNGMIAPIFSKNVFEEIIHSNEKIKVGISNF